MNRMLLAVVLLAALAAFCLGEGTVTNTHESVYTMKKVSLYWTASSSNGVADGTTPAISGEILRWMVIPDSGATGPTNLYDITVKDTEGGDVLDGRGANLTSNGTVVASGVTNNLPFAVQSGGGLAVGVTNAGPSNAGRIILWYR